MNPRALSPDTFVSLLDSVEHGDQPPATLDELDAADLRFARHLFGLRERPIAPARLPWHQPEATTVAAVQRAPGRAEGLVRSGGADGFAARGAVFAKLLIRQTRRFSVRLGSGEARLVGITMTAMLAVGLLAVWSVTSRLGREGALLTVPAASPTVAAGAPTDGVVGLPILAGAATPTARPRATSAALLAYPPPESPTPAAPAPTSPPPASPTVGAPQTAEPEPTNTPEARPPVAVTSPPPYPGPADTATPEPRVTRIAPPPIPTSEPTEPSGQPTVVPTPTPRNPGPTPTVAQGTSTPLATEVPPETSTPPSTARIFRIRRIPR
jgi:hypothetical protein